MKRLVIISLVLLLPLLFSYRAFAEDSALFEDEAQQLQDSVPDTVKDDMSRFGVTDLDWHAAFGLDLNHVFSSVMDIVTENAGSPFAACAVLIAVILLASLLESYTFSLRYTETKEVLAIVTSLMVILTIAGPISVLIQRCVDTIHVCSDIMLTYVPIMLTVMAFSGHVISSVGYEATVMASTQGISRLSSTVISPLLSSYLTLSLCAGLGDRIRIGGICEMLNKLIKWLLTFSMMLFTAVLSLQGVAAAGVDSLASRTVRLSLSSMIPLVGSSISEAYKTVQSSVNLMRTGMGVFVILAVIAAFLPLLIRILLWMAAIAVAKLCGDALGVSSTVSVFSAVSNLLSVQLALVISVGTVFLISTGVLMAIGGAT